MTGELVAKMIAWAILVGAVWWLLRFVIEVRRHNAQMRVMDSVTKILESPDFAFASEREATTVWYLLAKDDYAGAYTVLAASRSQNGPRPMIAWILGLWRGSLRAAVGRAAASVKDEDGVDTPTGSNQLGQPPTAATLDLVPVCFSCGFIGPNDPRLPCHVCGDNPWARGEERQRFPCVWKSTSVWWKPLSWCSGIWLPDRLTDATRVAEEVLARRTAEHELARARLERAQDRFGTLDSWER